MVALRFILFCLLLSKFISFQNACSVFVLFQRVSPCYVVVALRFILLCWLLPKFISFQNALLGFCLVFHRSTMLRRVTIKRIHFLWIRFFFFWESVDQICWYTMIHNETLKDTLEQEEKPNVTLRNKTQSKNNHTINVSLEVKMDGGSMHGIYRTQ